MGVGVTVKVTGGGVTVKVIGGVGARATADCWLHAERTSVVINPGTTRNLK